jgi:hypothetical protein
MEPKRFFQSNLLKALIFFCFGFVVLEPMDTALSKLMSRKLMVWLTATGLMLTETLPLQSGDWVAISLAYIGIQGLADIATQWKHGK